MNAFVEVALAFNGRAANLDVTRYVMVVAARRLLTDRSLVGFLALRACVLMTFRGLGSLIHDSAPLLGRAVSQVPFHFNIYTTNERPC